MTVEGIGKSTATGAAGRQIEDMSERRMCAVQIGGAKLFLE